MCLIIMIIISFDVVCIVYFMTEKNPPQAAADLSHTVRLVSRALYPLLVAFCFFSMYRFC